MRGTSTLEQADAVELASMIFDVTNDAMSFVGCHDGGDAGTAYGGRKEHFEPRQSLWSSSDRNLDKISSSMRSSSLRWSSAHFSVAGMLCSSAEVSTSLQEHELRASEHQEHLQHSCGATMSPEIAAAAVDAVSATAAAVGLGFDENRFGGSNDDVRVGCQTYHQEHPPPASIVRTETFGAGHRGAAEGAGASRNAGRSAAELGQLRLGVRGVNGVENGRMLGISARGQTQQPSHGRISNEVMKPSEHRDAEANLLGQCFSVVGTGQYQSIGGELVHSTSDIDPLCHAPDFFTPSAANGNSALPKRLNIDVGAFFAGNGCDIMPPLSSSNVESNTTLIHAGVDAVGAVLRASKNEDALEFIKCKNDAFSGDDRASSSNCASESSGKAVIKGSDRVGRGKSRRGKSSQDGSFETPMSSSYVAAGNDVGPQADEGEVSSLRSFTSQTSTHHTPFPIKKQFANQLNETTFN